MRTEKKILADSWYAEHLEGNVIKVDSYFKENYHSHLLSLSKRFNFVRGFLLFLASGKFDSIVTTRGGKGITFFIFLRAIFSSKRKKIILLEFFRPTPLSKLYKIIWPFWAKYIYGASLRRSVTKIHVLTDGEIEKYKDLFGVPKERFCFIPWPLHFDEQKSSDSPKSNDNDSKQVKISNYVMASGRANVDWETIFEVAEKSDWPFLAVCNSLNLERVNKLNKNNRAIVLHDISLEEHGKYVKGATVYALCLSETNTGVGHIRLMNTIEHGVPVVASDVTGLEGYAVDGINSVLVPPGDVTAFKKAIDILMNNAELRNQLVISARSFQQDRTFTNYLTEIKKYVNETVSAYNAKESIIMA